MNDFSKAIPTVYNGTQFKSRMESQCAFLFDQLGWDWKYESESLMLSNGVTYIPDFSINSGALIVECRGYENKRGAAQITGFIKDLTKKARDRREWCSFLVMGPDDCTTYISDMVGVAKYPARVTYCPRCDKWSLHWFTRAWAELCPICVQLTFNDYAITVANGKFFFGYRPLEEAGTFFSRDTQRAAWAVNFHQFVLSALNNPGASESDQEALGEILDRLFVKEGA